MIYGFLTRLSFSSAAPFVGNMLLFACVLYLGKSVVNSVAVPIIQFACLCVCLKRLTFKLKLNEHLLIENILEVRSLQCLFHCLFFLRFGRQLFVHEVLSF